MRLYNERLNAIIDYVIKKALQQGILLTSEEFKEKLNQAIKGLNLAKPFFKKKDVRYRYTLDDYNQSKEYLKNDFDVFFKTIKDLYKQLQENIDKYESLKVSKEKIINDMDNSLQETIFKYAPNEYLNSYKETFINNNNIKDSENILINLINHEISLNRSIVSKYNLTKDNVSVEVDEPLYTVSEYTEGKPYKVTITKQKQSSTYCKIIIDLKESTYVSSMNLRFSFIKPASIEIDTDAFTIYESTITSNKTIEVNGFCKTITISFLKKEADKIGIDDKKNNTYQYIYCIDNIEILNNNYVAKGYLESKAIDLPEGIESFKFSAEDFIPNNTKIDYYYKTNPDENWAPLRKNMAYDLLNNHDVNTSSDNYIIEPNQEDVARNQLYIIKDITGPISSCKIYKGNNTWQQDLYSINKEKFDEETFLQDIAKIDPVNTEYVDATERFGLLLSNETIDENPLWQNKKNDDALNTFVIKWSIYTYAEESISDKYDIIQSNLNTDNKYYVYINGVLCNEKYIFNKGWNYIEVYAPISISTTEENPVKRTFIIPFPQTGFKYILLNNTSMNEVDYQYLRFSRDIDVATEYSILNKTADDVSHNYIMVADEDPTSNYLIEYNTSNAVENKLYIKADLGTIDSLYTPKLYSYQIVYK